MTKHAGGRRGKYIMVRVNPLEDREFKLVARAENMTVSEMVRRAVRERTDRLVSVRGEAE